MSGPAIAGDWAVWVDAWHRLEADWLAPALAALRARQIDALQLVLGGRTSVLDVRLTRPALSAFWRRPSLDRLHA